MLAVFILLNVIVFGVAAFISIDVCGLRKYTDGERKMLESYSFR